MNFCTVTGTVRHPDGKPIGLVTFTPQHTGFVGQAFVSRTEVRVIPNDSGQFSVSLAPSEVVGTYLVKMGEEKFRVTVPTAIAVRFATLLDKSQEN